MKVRSKKGFGGQIIKGKVYEVIHPFDEYVYTVTNEDGRLMTLQKDIFEKVYELTHEQHDFLFKSVSIFLYSKFNINEKLTNIIDSQLYYESDRDMLLKLRGEYISEVNYNNS